MAIDFVPGVLFLKSSSTVLYEIFAPEKEFVKLRSAYPVS